MAVLERGFRELPTSVCVCEDVDANLGSAHRKLGGTLLLAERPSWGGEATLVWQATRSRLALSILKNPSNAAAHEIVSGEFRDVPDADEIIAVDVMEFVTEVSDDAEPRLVFFVLTSASIVHRICVAHPCSPRSFAGASTHGRSWGHPPEAPSSYRLTRHAAEQSEAVDIVVLNAFTVVVAFSTGSITRLTIHPDLIQDPSRCEIELNPCPRMQGLLQSLWSRGSERIRPVAIGNLPVLTISEDGQTENETNYLMVLCSDGRLRLWSLQETAAFAVFPVSEECLTSGMIRVAPSNRNKFHVLLYLSSEESSCFKECLIDATQSMPTFQMNSTIPDPQLPLIDARLAPGMVWGLWRKPNGYLLQHWPLSWRNNDTISLGWNPVHTLSDDEDAFDLDNAPVPASMMKEFFNRQLFQNGRFHSSVIAGVLQSVHGITPEVNTRTELQRAVFQLIDGYVAADMKERSEVEMEESLLRHWRRLVDECKIRQLYIDEPVALGFYQSDRLGSACLVKHLGVSLLRQTDVAEKLLWARSSDSEVSFKLPFQITDDRSVDSDILSLLKSSHSFLLSIDSVDQMLFGFDTCPPQNINTASLMTSVSDAIMDSVDPGELLSRLYKRVHETWEAVANPKAALQALIELLVLPTDQDQGEDRQDHTLTPTQGQNIMIASAATQIVRCRFILLRDLSIFLSFLISSNGINLPDMIESAVIPKVLNLFQSYMLMRWVSQQEVLRASQAETGVAELESFAALGLGPNVSSSLGLNASFLQRRLMELILSCGWKCGYSTSLLNLALHSCGFMFGHSYNASKISDPDGVAIEQSKTLLIAQVLAKYGQFAALQEFVGNCINHSMNTSHRLRLQYFAGLSALHFAQYHKAKQFFLQTWNLFEHESTENVDEFLRRYVLTAPPGLKAPLDQKSSLDAPYEYVLHIMELFESFSRLDLALEMAYIGLRVDESDDSRRIHPHLQNSIFNCSITLERYEEAFAVMVALSNDTADVRSACLRQLVASLCSSDQVAKLCDFPWADLRNEVESTLLRKANTCDLIAVRNGEAPDFYGILYAFAVKLEDYRGASRYMFDCACRWARELSRMDPAQCLRLQCQCLAAAINALQLVPDHQWLLQTVGSTSGSSAVASVGRRRKRDDAFDFDSGHGSQSQSSDDLVSSAASLVHAVVRLEDMQKRHLLCEAQLSLSEASPNQRIVYADLSPRETIACLLEKGFIDQAFDICAAFCPTDIGAVFEVLLDKCVALDHGARPEDVCLQVGYAGCFQSLTKAAWSMLQNKLDQFDSKATDFELSKKVATKLLASCTRSKLPQWLVGRFMPISKSPNDCGFSRCSADPAWLVRLLLRYHMPKEAASVCLKSLPTPEYGITRSRPTWIPQSLLNQLTHVLLHSSDAIAEELAKRIEERVQALARRTLDVPALTVSAMQWN